MAQQTAVEWLVEQMIYQMAIRIENTTIGCELFEQAKQMERKKKIEFAKHCLDKALDLDIRTVHCNVEKYYSETYGKE